MIGRKLLSIMQSFMVIAVIKVFLFFLGLAFFGWQFFGLITKERRIEILGAFSILIGGTFYLFFLNLTSYFIPIKINFFLIFIILVLLGFCIYKLDKKKEKLVWWLDKRWRKIILIFTLFIMLSSWLVTARSLENDDLNLGHLPTAATIAEGNFPVMSLIVPSVHYANHYGPELFSAALSEVTGLPLWYDYDLQIFIYIGVLFLLCFIFIKEITQNNKISLITSFIVLYGGSLNFLYFYQGIINFYKIIFLGQHLTAPFKFMAEMTQFNLTASVINTIHHHSPVLAYPLIIAVAYLLYKFINNPTKWKLILPTIIFLAYLALNAETYFVVLISSIIVFLVLFIISVKDKKKIKNLIIFTILTCLIAVKIAFFQGGVLSQYVYQNQVIAGKVTHDIVMKINFQQFDYIIQNNLPVKIFSLFTLLDFGLVIILIIPAIIYFFVRKKYLGLITFFTLLGGISFIIPFLFVLVGHPWDINRFFYLTTLCWNLVVGLFLAHLFVGLKKTKLKKFIILILIFCFVAYSINFQIIYSLKPRGRWSEKSYPFWGALNKPDVKDQLIYNWIKNNTDINDYFFTYDDDHSTHVGPNYRFIIFTGRFAPIYRISRTYQYQPNYQIELFDKIENSCDFMALKELNYRYLYVNEFWPAGLEEKCLIKNNIIKIFEVDKNHIIYKLK